MTTEDTGEASENLELLNENLAKIEELSQRLVSALSNKNQVNPGLQGPGQDLYARAASAYANDLVSNPSKIFEHQVGYWGKALTHYMEAQKNLMQGVFEPPEDKTAADPRFSHDMWSDHPYFNFIKQQYLMSAEAITNAVEDLDDLPEPPLVLLREHVARFGCALVQGARICLGPRGGPHGGGGEHGKKLLSVFA